MFTTTLVKQQWTLVYVSTYPIISDATRPQTDWLSRPLTVNIFLSTSQIFNIKFAFWKGNLNGTNTKYVQKRSHEQLPF